VDNRTARVNNVGHITFLKAFRSLKSFRKKSTFSTWLYRIVYNTSISLVRSRKNKILSLEDFPADVIDFMRITPDEDEAEREYKNSLVSFALQKIGDEERGIITLHYYDELSIEEMSAVTGISRANIRVKLFRARQKMTEIIRTSEKKENLRQSTLHTSNFPNHE